MWQIACAAALLQNRKKCRGIEKRMWGVKLGVNPGKAQGVAEIRSLILPFCLKIQTKTKRTEYKFCSHNSAVLRGDDQEGLGRIADFSPV